MIEIWGKPRCIYCIQAKDLCEQFGLEYNYREIKNAEQLEGLIERCGVPFKTVPQIFWDNEYIGGYEEFFQKVASENAKTESKYHG